jgi:hypothetical protein
VIEPADERPHEHGGEAGWSERLSFSFFDAASGFGGIVRVDLRPGEQRADGTLSLFMPGGAIATVLARDQNRAPGGSSVARIQLDPVEALTKWWIRCKDVALIFPNASASGLPRAGERTGAASQIDLQLTFETWMQPAGEAERVTKVDELNFVRTMSTGHFEQAGRLHGKVRVGPRQAALEATGVRDKTWGPLDPTAQHSSRWFAVAFGPALAFGVRAVSLGTRDLHSGWVMRDGDVRGLKSCRLESEYEGRVMRAARLAIVDDSGDSYELTSETHSVIPLQEGGARVHQAMVRYKLGDREALGLMEEVGGR